MKNKTTKKHFAIFKKECEYWLDYFGIKDYDVSFKHVLINPDSCAETSWNIVGRVATITLNINWTNSSLTDLDLKRTAFHEVCELLLGDMTHYLSAYYSVSFMEMNTHILITRLENSVFMEKRG